MTLSEILTDVHGFFDANALPVFLTCVGVPVVGTALAWVARGGRTDRDGRVIANVVLSFGLVAFVFAMLAIVVARWAFDVSLLDANALLLVGPLLALGLALLGVRLVFPLSELGSARTARDVGLLVLLIIGLIWLFGQFRGWGVVFFGGVAQLAAIGLFLFVLVRRMARRAFKGDGRSPQSSASRTHFR